EPRARRVAAATRRRGVQWPTSDSPAPTVPSTTCTRATASAASCATETEDRDDPLLLRLGLAVLVAGPARARGEGARLRARAAQLRERRAQVARTPGAQPARQGAGARGRRRLALRVERDRRVPGGALPAHAAPAARPAARRRGPLREPPGPVHFPWRFLPPPPLVLLTPAAHPRSAPI